MGIEVFALITSLAKFSEDLRNLPRVVAQKVAAKAAPAITALAIQTFNASTDAYGTPWKPGADGRPVELHRTGAMFNTLVYVANGTKLRVKLSVPYAKYQIGTRNVFPKQGEALPPAYAETLARVAVEVCREEMRQ